ncbi:hypothetical protein BL250_13490 [Erwinia sp. OLTSP20]|uniref:class I SAM-dependent methyltransferase n=1 Tax=unclassified Erwinia TaxID=2622719 RepID=UPI000C19C8FF|nr:MULTISPECIES: class I SAM-dependent methyltransferase [unclassified Erwinia]PIJ48534.1 hypothetical protein BV501_16795 [Erwinia sp. OAMSP11]PIJ69146.1 hypothetical protein BK416_15435 [Erwinia sp. OLSSP12]PIJ78381.1 hypothetical protein BLD47_17255 [Erwinia sp. OLCASP19]PIJ81090.1 hypothetical protein BLD49_16815 [Erwinia sp. OLMDSP33]PIJ81825.1 hypothetical protein BLD46_12120 [Erwinia sp. OLMTSP26]
MTNNQTNIILQEHGFIYDSELNIWIEKEKEKFNYNDGDEHENYILDVVSNASDCSVLSHELANKIKDWPSQYHLTSKRSNLLRPFSDKFKGKRVLEIGCGCGAITRFVAECGADITSIEGSKRRATITRKRCKDLDNVTVICASSRNLPDIGQFDYVLLIGVLEYAQCFLGYDGQKSLLQSCKSRLTPSGALFVAIENQLGMKYLAGAKEDHLGIPMAGINDAYDENGVKTFGRVELNKIIKSVGFSEVLEYLPFPDYKLPTLLITPKGHEEFSDIIYPLVSEVHYKDAQRSDTYTFSLEQATKIIWKNKLSAELSNSFLMVVSESDVKLDDDSSLAWYYSDVRKNDNNKKIRFFVENNNVSIETFKFEGELISSERFYQGDSLWLGLVGLVNKYDWLVKDIIIWVERWIEAILQDAGEKDNLRWDLELPKKYLDATPFNVISTKDGPMIFDLELEVEKPLLISRLVFRGVFNSFLRLTSISSTHNIPDYNIFNLTKGILLEVFPGMDEDSVENLLADEVELVAGIINVNKNDLIERYKNSYFVVRNSVNEKKLLENKIRQLEEENKMIELQAESIREELKIKNGYIDAILSSKSWKLVSLLKRIANPFRK